MSMRPGRNGGRSRIIARRRERAGAGNYRFPAGSAQAGSGRRRKMVSLEAAGVTGSASMIGATSEISFGVGAIAGALLVGAAYLAGFAAFRRSAAAVCALVMVSAAAALQFASLGLPAPAAPGAVALLQGVFAGAALVFLASTIEAGRNNFYLGGLMFVTALLAVGLGAVAFAGVGAAGALMKWLLTGVGVFVLLFVLSQVRRDPGARLILPGVLVALAGPALAGFTPFGGAAATLAPHGLFAFGVLAASLVALTKGSSVRVTELRPQTELPPQQQAAADSVRFTEGGDETPGESAPAETLAETQLAQVLDYAGIALWDWSPESAHQSRSLPTLMGADTRAPFSPGQMRAFIHKDDIARFERKIAAPLDGDGGFDLTLKLYDGRVARFRGARAVDPTGSVERIVAFVESVHESARQARGRQDSETGVIAGTANPLLPAFGEAIEKGEIGVDFQPIVNLDSGAIAGFEALARWRGQNNGVPVGAEELVKAAEESGKGGALALFVLKEAAAFLARRREERPEESAFVAMNASYRQLAEKGFASAVQKTREDHRIPDKSLVIELTESQEIKDDAAAARIFTDLRAAGAALAFDDFGAGFSSLSNLAKFSFDYLKIDKSFITDIGTNPEKRKIAQAIARLGGELGLVVIAEGVEAKEIAAAARKIGCALGQGYALGPPAAGGPSSGEPGVAAATPRGAQERALSRASWGRALR